MDLQDGKRKVRKRRKRNQNPGLIAFILFLVLIITILGAGCAYFYIQYLEQKNEVVAAWAEVGNVKSENIAENVYSHEQIEEIILKAQTDTSEEILTKLKGFMEDGEGVVQTLQYFYPDQIIMLDGNKYLFFDILPNLLKNGIKNENIRLTEENELEYFENGEKVSRKGIDVSKFQGEIDWEKVKADEVDFAYLRVGIRGYESGAIVADETFKQNAEAAAKNGVDVGAYFFGQAINEEEAIEEAEFVIDNLKDCDITSPVVYDVEHISSPNARTGDLTKEERTKITRTFCDKVKEAGYTPMIYGNVKTFMLMLDIEQLEEYEKWFAGYRDVIYFPYKIKLWQYTEKGRVNGIEGDVDLNISFY